jgi:hypothetical protein
MNTLRLLHLAQRLSADEFAFRCRGLSAAAVVALGSEQITPDTLASLMGNLADEATFDRISALHEFADRIKAFATELLLAAARNGKEAA